MAHASQQRTVSALRFHFFNPNGSTAELPVLLGNAEGKHRPLDRRKTWLDVRKGSQIVLHYPGRAPEARPAVEGMPEIVSGRDWVENGTVLDPRP